MLIEFKGKKPEIAADIFIAPGSQLIGEVVVKQKSSIWFNAVLRGDLAPIRIGEKTNIQENCSLHVDHDQPLNIGNQVTVGHGAILHSCQIEDNCLIGMGATILNGAVIGKNSIVGAGALIPENREIPPESLVVGLPGKVIRNLKEKEIKKLKEQAAEYYRLAREYNNERGR